MMEARGAAERPPLSARVPSWVLGLAPLALIAVAVAAFALLGAPGLGSRNGPPVEDLSVERTVLRPGEIELSVRNDGPDSVRIAQVSVNDGFVDFHADQPEVDRLGSEKLTIPYPWIEGEGYDIVLLTSTGGTIEHDIPVAVETPDTDSGFFGLMALLGVYVGVIPIALGMLWLPFVRSIDARWIRLLMALTVGLLAFLAIDATQEGVETALDGSQAFGGAALVFLGALAAYLALSGVDAYMRTRDSRERAAGASGASLALLIAIGIGLHNLGEGLAIGSAYTVGALALGTFLVIGFAIHNTTEGLAIVAPLAGRPPGIPRLAGLGLIAGAPVILGALIGAAAFNSNIAALLLGVGAGAIAQVIHQLLPSIRDKEGRTLNPASVVGILTGLALLYATSLLVSV
jgi:zinc transporter, ZIP family